MQTVSVRNNVAFLANCNTVPTKESNVTEDGIPVIAGIEKAFGVIDYNKQAEIEWNKVMDKVERATINKKLVAEVGMLPDWAQQVELGLYRRKPRESRNKS